MGKPDAGGVHALGADSVPGTQVEALYHNARAGNVHDGGMLVVHPGLQELVRTGRRGRLHHCRDRVRAVRTAVHCLAQEVLQARYRQRVTKKHVRHRRMPLLKNVKLINYE